MNLRITPLVAGALLMAPSALAQKPQPRSPLEIGQDFVVESVMMADRAMSVDVRTNLPTGLFDVDFRATPGTPESMARTFLSAYSDLARLPSQDAIRTT